MSPSGTIHGIADAVVGSGQKGSVVWNAPVFRNMLLRHPLLSDRIFKESLRTLVEKERLLIDLVARLARRIDKPSE